ncbi:hypothetical protein ACJ2A9_09455 [Anaerobacillus sp. MEB173]|uniref:hypothetical protein n=1 Tax=Anaerobacillus sp. MEB173 TaxID=3383345 RepID=UPI003F90C52C
MKRMLLLTVVLPLSLLLILSGCNGFQFAKIQTVQEDHTDTNNEWNEIPYEAELSSDQQHAEIIDEERPHAAMINETLLEDAAIGRLFSIEQRLGTLREELEEQRGKPIATGSYEGGDFYQYHDCTFFINPEDNRIVAIAVQMEEELYGSDIKAIFGKPNFEGMNHMDGLWMIEYYVNENSVTFESIDEFSKIEYVWLMQAIIQ